MKSDRPVFPGPPAARRLCVQPSRLARAPRPPLDPLSWLVLPGFFPLSYLRGSCKWGPHTVLGGRLRPTALGSTSSQLSGNLLSAVSQGAGPLLCLGNLRAEARAPRPLTETRRNGVKPLQPVLTRHLRF